MLDAELKEILAQCYANDEAFCRIIMPELFTAPFEDVHHKIFEVFRDTVRRKRCVLAPRGIGKTTIMRALLAKSIIYRDKHFIVYLSNSSTLAEMQTENLKCELLGNPLVKKVFGDIKINEEVNDIDESFSKKSWVAFGNTLVLPRGLGQQVRGLNWRGHRPDLIVLDDPENKEDLMNEETRKKLRSWFFSDLLKCTSLLDKSWEIFYIDTLKHQDALPVHLKKLPDWRCETLSICNEKIETLCPGFISQEELNDLYETHRTAGALDEFYREYMNVPIAPETACFRQEHFKYFEPADLPKGLETVILVDPAKSINPNADESAVVCVGVDTSNQSIYILDIFSSRVYPDELYDEIINMARRHKVGVVGIEVNSLNEFITYPFKTELIRRGATDIELVELKPKRKKEERIRSLIPFYRRGYIYHNATCCRGLEAQLMTFPNSLHDDVMDALAYIVPMLEEGGRYFESENADDSYTETLEGLEDLPPIEESEWCCI